MAIRYNPTPLDILNFLGCTSSGGQAELEKFETANNVKLPRLLFDFLSAAWKQPLFATSDIWTTKRPHLWFFYDELAESIADLQEDWAECPEQYTDDVCFKLSQLPKERWPEIVPDYLEIGSDYSAGVATFGIRRDDLAQPDPPVYMLHEADPETDWHIIDETLSLFLMRMLADTLGCSMYKTAQNVLAKKAGWHYCRIKDSTEARQQAEQLGIDLTKAACCGALYSAAVTPDVCRYCYIEDKKTFFLLIEDTGNNKTTCVIISAD